MKLIHDSSVTLNERQNLGKTRLIQYLDNFTLNHTYQKYYYYQDHFTKYIARILQNKFISTL